MELQWWGTRNKPIHASVDGGETTLCKARMSRMTEVEVDPKVICERCAMTLVEEKISYGG